MMRYLAFDDGYEVCIDPLDPGAAEAWKLKGLKFQHLLALAHVRDRWVMRMGPRNRGDGPGFSSAVPAVVGRAGEHRADPPTFDLRNLRFDASRIVSTCRLITLTVDDLGGEAARVLAAALAEGTAGTTFSVERQGDASEFRASSCIFRLVDMMLWRYPSTVAEDMELLAGADGPAFGSSEWMVAHVRLGEMQSLEILGGTMKQHARQLKAKLDESGADPRSFTVRKKPCPLELTKPLMEAEYE